MPTYIGGEQFAHNGFPRTTMMAELSIATVAALAPDDFEVRLCDATFEDVDLDANADFVGITGRVNQWPHGRELAGEFRRRGKTVLIGGSFASLSPGTVRPHCDVLVRGEIEEIAGELFGDLASGAWKDEYAGGRPELDGTKVPRWDLYRNERALMGTVQTSRGCPFECEFCDVIAYLGRRQRHKPVAKILEECDYVYSLGYRKIFLTDDNFTVYRGFAKEVLGALAEWQADLADGKVEFLTQLSIDAARDDELLRMCAEAGLIHSYIGIETPNEESLRETKKRQNLVDMTAALEKFARYGITVAGGCIVGFDHDGPDIFERQFEFLQGTPVPHLTVGSLTAPAATPLEARLAAEGRLLADGAGIIAMPWNSNLVPAQMSPEELVAGVKWLANNLYDPANYGRRLLRFIELYEGPRDPAHLDPRGTGPLRPVDMDAMQLLTHVPSLGSEEARMFREVTHAARAKPGALSYVGNFLVLYMQVRYMYEAGSFWDPSLVGRPVFA